MAVPGATTSQKGEPMADMRTLANERRVAREQLAATICRRFLLAAQVTSDVERCADLLVRAGRRPEATLVAAIGELVR